MNRDQWISVSDALPELPDGAPRSVTVIACYQGKVIPMTYERTVRSKGMETHWRFHGGRIAPLKPTHWMPLPGPPA